MRYRAVEGGLRSRAQTRCLKRQSATPSLPKMSLRRSIARRGGSLSLPKKILSRIRLNGRTSMHVRETTGTSFRCTGSSCTHTPTSILEDLLTKVFAETSPPWQPVQGFDDAPPMSSSTLVTQLEDALPAGWGNQSALQGGTGSQQDLSDSLRPGRANNVHLPCHRVSFSHRVSSTRGTRVANCDG